MNLGFYDIIDYLYYNAVDSLIEGSNHGKNG